MPYQRVRWYNSLRCLGLLVLLWCWLLFRGERVGEGSANGDGGSDDGVALHGFLEHEGGNDDDDDALGGVEHGGCDGTDTGGEGKGELVVDVEEESGEEDVHHYGVGGVLGGGLVPGLLEGWEFLNDDEWDGAAEGDDVHDCVHVGGVHVLAWVGFELLGDAGSDLSLERGRCVGHGGEEERLDVDVDTLALLDAGKSNTSDDWDEHGVRK
mmetsp:Transcript_959/g.2764  ORF Transcript_959/g.2764 Transcript_959/m.2764 type:complete len:211 (-) Transcript_959:431-1063(-)